MTIAVTTDLRPPHPADLMRSLKPGDLEGVRAVFVNMPLRESALPNNAPLGPAMLAARLRQYGANVSIVDLNAYRVVDEDSNRRGLPHGRYLSLAEARDLIARHFLRHDIPDLVAFSGLITTLRWQERMAAIVRELAPETLLVSGNGLATEFREGLFEWIPELDAVSHSEGDDVILKIALDAKHMRERGWRAAERAGLLTPYLIGEHAGRPRLLYHGDRPRDLDLLPFPAWDLLHEDVDGKRLLDFYLGNAVWGGGASNSSAAPFTMTRSLSTVSSRGCPFDCHFCYRGAQGERNYGTRSAQHLVAEMRWLWESYDVDFVGLTDDNFMVNPKRIQHLVGEMKPLLAESGIRWGTHGRLDEAADIRPDVKGGKGAVKHNAIRRCDLMAEAGCVYIGFGAESAHPRVLDAMGKGGFILANGTVTIDGFEFPLTMVEGIKATKKSGIHGNCTWIMGYPGETLDELKTSVAFIRWQEDLYSAGLTVGSDEHTRAMFSVNKNVFTATAYPGTKMFEHPRVRELLAANFGIRFDPDTQKPLCDDALHHYVLELDDATKVLRDRKGRPLNFSAMSDEVFLRAREHVNEGELYRILEMT